MKSNTQHSPGANFLTFEVHARGEIGLELTVASAVKLTAYLSRWKVRHCHRGSLTRDGQPRSDRREAARLQRMRTQRHLERKCFFVQTPKLETSNSQRVVEQTPGSVCGPSSSGWFPIPTTSKITHPKMLALVCLCCNGLKYFLHQKFIFKIDQI